jgi:hypothetical protein
MPVRIMYCEISIASKPYDFFIHSITYVSYFATFNYSDAEKKIERIDVCKYNQSENQSESPFHEVSSDELILSLMNANADCRLQIADCRNILIEEPHIFMLISFCHSILFVQENLIARKDFLHFLSSFEVINESPRHFRDI